MKFRDVELTQLRPLECLFIDFNRFLPSKIDFSGRKINYFQQAYFQVCLYIFQHSEINPFLAEETYAIPLYEYSSPQLREVKSFP